MCLYCAVLASFGSRLVAECSAWLVAVGVACACVMTCGAAAADEAPATSGRLLPLDPFHAGITLGFGAGRVDEETARAEKLGQAGSTFHLGITVELFDVVSAGFSIGTISLKDHAQYQETVVEEGNLSEPFEADSSLGTMILGLSAGPRTPSLCLWSGINVYMAMFLYARYGSAWISGERSVPLCVDCSSEELRLRDGSFLESGTDIGFHFGNFGLSLFAGYRRYFGGAAVQGEVQAGLGFSFG